MEKQKRWQFYLIVAVLILTLYNILPTIFYYTKPLGAPIDATRAQEIALSIADRANSLEEESKEWLGSFSRLLGLSPASITSQANDPRIFEVTFKSSNEANVFKRFLSRAGRLIPFVPAQLDLYQSGAPIEANKVLVSRQIGVKLDPKEIDQLFQFTTKYDSNGKLSPLYREIVLDRIQAIALAFGGDSKTASQLQAAFIENSETNNEELILAIAKEIVESDASLGKDSPIAKRYFSSFTQSSASDANQFIAQYIAKADALKTKLTGQQERLAEEQKKLKASGSQADFSDQQAINFVEANRKAIDSALAILKKQQANFKAGQKPLTDKEVISTLNKGADAVTPQNHIQVLNLQGRNPFVEALVINWEDSSVQTQFYPDVQAIRTSEDKTEAGAYLKEKLNQLIINDVARASQLSDENILANEDAFAIQLDTLPASQSYLAFNLGSIANKQSQSLYNQLMAGWTPSSRDLERDRYPIRTYDQWKTESPEEQRLGLVIYAPATVKGEAPKGFRPGSMYIIAKGLDSIDQKFRQSPESPESQSFMDDLGSLSSILNQNGFIGYSGAAYGMAPEFAKDYIFELDDYYSNLLKATRENFVVKGSKRYAVLDFSDVEQRILTQNRIDDRKQEDLLKWKEEYDVAQVDPNATNRYLIPKPTANPFWQNFKLNFVKYFRGDDRKILKWGLDLSGGKTVRIGLRDSNNRPVTNPEDVKQAVNELYTRINKMGVSERTIHVENNNIILDFPGSQNMSAADLVKASAMYFHIVNEKFTPQNPNLREAVNHFLQDIWNEAVVTNRKDIDSINDIAWHHLGANSADGLPSRPMSEYAKTLYDNGLRLSNPKERSISGAFNDTLSSIAMMRGNDFSDWEGQTHPLIVTFANFALEGASLTNVHVGYDPAEGNILTFSIKNSYEGGRTGSPREDFYTWTSQFAEDKIIGTPKEQYAQGRGWRMAVILNGTIISKPSLRAALRDGATISGRFSQREVSQLAADLKAGSLSFTPRILSEQNVSPELGREERTKGIVASVVALVLVVVAMVGYYHFAGVVASCAVLLNILIMWGVLQNLDAALTLPGIAGIVLTIGMAIDANVLVFERIREEFKVSGRIGSAIQAGYRKAFTAIVDSNITTIIAALILIQFDSGPIKGFAVVVIIGIVSSMFTALFMTRYYFAGWVQNPKNKSLSMSQFIGNTNFDFLGKTRIAVIATAVVLIAGTYAFIEQRNVFFGMDFTGGYSLVVDLQEKGSETNYRLEAAEALQNQGATSNDYQIRELSQPNQLRIQLGVGMEEKGHPFYQMPDTLEEGKYTYPYQKNPRIVWVVNALAEKGLNIEPAELASLDTNWSVMSGQFSDAMRNNALIALGLALLSILIYITVRFEFKYAIASVIGLTHDVLLTVGILAIFHWMGLQVQIDLQVVGAIMMIIGYSLNDTIIVFDRIREDLKIFRKMKFEEVVNHALNVTLARTMMTSGTTILVLLTLVLLGGKSIFAFSLVMTIGIVVGTLSSLFIAAPTLVFFHNREVDQHTKAPTERRT